MRKKAKMSDDPWSLFLRYFDENRSAGTALRKLLSHISDPQAQRDLLQDVAIHVRFYILDNGELNRGRQERKEIEHQSLKATERYHERMAEHYRKANEGDAVRSSEREIAKIKSKRTKLKEAFDTQRMGRGRNHLPIVVLKRLVLVKTGAELQPQEIAWLLEAGYCAWGCNGHQDVDAERLRKALTHFEKRNPAMMAQIITRYSQS
jgi:hypothetical protein